MEKCELVFIDSKSSKFWNIELGDQSFTVTYGRTGTKGQSKTKEFDSPEAARKEYEKLVTEKLNKGYSHQTNGDDSDGSTIPLTAFESVTVSDDIYDNVKVFVGKKVVDYNPKKKTDASGKTIYRFRSDWEEPRLLGNLTEFIQSDSAMAATGLVIGSWSGDDPDNNCEPIIKLLVEHAEKLPQLNAIFLGDIVQSENEMSWIQQGDVSPLLEAFPNLQMLRTRGSDGLSISQPVHHQLRGLALESGGMPVDVVRSVCNSLFPELEHLEIWLGTEHYGANSAVQDLQPILTGDLFPKLKYLGLRNCDYVDDIAAVVVNSPIIDQLESLDLSLGVLTDEGALALTSLPTGGNLKHVSIHHHYASSDVIKKLKGHSINFDTSNPSHMDTDEEWRFVAVGE